VVGVFALAAVSRSAFVQHHLSRTAPPPAPILGVSHNGSAKASYLPEIATPPGSPSKALYPLTRYDALLRQVSASLRRHAAVAYKLRWCFLASFLARVTNFSLWPAFLSTQLPYRGGFGQGASWLANDGWWATALSTVYFVSKVSGSGASQPRFAPRSAAVLVAVSAAFVLFIPVFVGCALLGGGFPLLEDTVAICATAALQFTFAALTTLNMMTGSTLVEATERDAAGFITDLSSRVFQLVGASAAVILVGLVDSRASAAAALR
jgi:hypothetical protein